MKAGLQCCCWLLVAIFSLTSVQGNRRELRDWLAPAAAPQQLSVPATAPVSSQEAAESVAWADSSSSSASASVPPVSAPASVVPSPTSRGSQTPPGFPGPPPPPPPPPPPSPETFPSPPPPPPPISYWPYTSPVVSDSAAPPTSATTSSSSGYVPPTVHSAPSGSGAPTSAPSTSSSGSEWPSALAPGPAPAVKISSAATVPSVSASVMLPSFTLQSFDTAAQAQFISAIEAAYPGNNVSVKINNVMSGSVVVNETTTFLDGDSSAANSNAQAMALSPSTIFPAGTYGNVTTSSVTSTNMTNPAVLTASPSPATTAAPTSGAKAFAAISLSALAGAGCLMAFSL